VAREVDADQGVISRQPVAHRAPQARRLREPVQQDQGWTGAAQFDVEWHGA
jgi:hypothetical protein